LTSSGHASKDQIKRMVERLTDLQPQPGMRLDETDAIALALAAMYQRSHPLGRLALARSAAPTPRSRSAGAARSTDRRLAPGLPGNSDTIYRNVDGSILRP
jgi:hypothetical protein